MKNATQTLKGFRDFLPAEKNAREYVKAIIVNTFKIYGFENLETPTLEYASLLLGKYGEEADKLVFTFEDQGGRKVGLRYDQTVPTARVLAQYQNQLPKNFRRFQIQNVFRADKPQKGRFREFTQCDADIFGPSTATADAEIVSVFYAIFKAIGFQNISIAINDRQTLIKALEPFQTSSVSVFSLIQSIDKLDKLSVDQVIDELVKKGLTEKASQSAIQNILNTSPSNSLSDMIRIAVSLGVPENCLRFEPTLARGLDYYTGLIFEGKLKEYPIGSLGGGGRYDKLISDLSGLSIPAVGFGLGFDRIVEAANELNLIPHQLSGPLTLIACFAPDYATYAGEVAARLRAHGIPTEMFPDPSVKIVKQFKSANQKNIPYVVVIGQDEVSQQKITLKNMGSGEQEILSLEACVKKLISALPTHG